MDTNLFMCHNLKTLQFSSPDIFHIYRPSYISFKSILKICLKKKKIKHQGCSYPFSYPDFLLQEKDVIFTIPNVLYDNVNEAHTDWAQEG